MEDVALGDGVADLFVELSTRCLVDLSANPPLPDSIRAKIDCNQEQYEKQQHSNPDLKVSE
jgi:hypothetical protein